MNFQWTAILSIAAWLIIGYWYDGLSITNLILYIRKYNTPTTTTEHKLWWSYLVNYLCQQKSYFLSILNEVSFSWNFLMKTWLSLSPWSVGGLNLHTKNIFCQEKSRTMQRGIACYVLLWLRGCCWCSSISTPFTIIPLTNL